jgi:hypothetical protein
MIVQKEQTLSHPMGKEVAHMTTKKSASKGPKKSGTKK